MTISDSDGYSNEMHMYLSPIKFVDEDGFVKFIDNTFISSGKKMNFWKKYKYENKANDIKTYYPKDIDDGVLLEYEDYAVSLNPVKKSKSVAKLVDVDGEQYCEYTEVDKNISLQYKSINTGIKENIILESYGGTNVFQFNVNLEGLVPLFTRGESIPLVEPGSEEVVAIIGQVDARDSYVGDYPEDEVHFTLYNELSVEHIKGDEYLLNVIVDKEFLESENTVYPVVIDPSITVSGSSDIKDTSVYEGYPDRQTFYTSSYLIVGDHGSAYGQGEAYIQMTNIEDYTYIDPDDVTYAYFHVYEGSGKTNDAEIRVYDTYSMWDDTTITWNNKPNTYKYDSCEIEYEAVAHLKKSGWYNINITKLFRYWLGKARGEYGWSQRYGFAMITDYKGESSKHFCSSEHGTKPPSIVVEYTTSGYGAAGSYVQKNGDTVNCVGYALGVDQFLDDLPITMNDTLEVAIEKWQSYVRNRFGYGIRRISDANSYINSGEYRIAMRIANNPGYTGGIRFDYHFWVQINTGQWAHKKGPDPSQLIGYINPSYAIWNSVGDEPRFDSYNSDTIYFAIAK